jgi:integrase
MRLYRHSNGIYYVALPGNVRKSLCTRNEREAQAKFKQLQKIALNQKLVTLDQSDRICYDEFVTEYLEGRVEMSKSTLRMDSLALRTFGGTLSGNPALKSITLQTIDNFKKICKARGMSTISINTYLRHVKAAFSKAVDLGYMKTIKINPLKTPKHLPRILSPDEIELILAMSPYAMRRIIKFALFTGCRLAEILNLQWRHIKAGSALITGKGDKQRVIPLVNGAMEAVGEPKLEGHVFTHFHPDTVSHYFKRIARSVGIEDIHFHNLRHSAASQMMSCGVNVAVIQKVLGHADIKTTMHYAQVIDPFKESEMDKFDF